MLRDGGQYQAKEIALFGLLLLMVAVLIYDSLQYGWIVTLGFSLVGLQIAAGIWVYFDAKARSQKNPILWFMALTLPVLGILVLPVYISSREPPSAV